METVKNKAILGRTGTYLSPPKSGEGNTLGAKPALADKQGRKTYLQMGLVHAGITAGQLGYGDSHEDHEEARGEVLVFCLTLQLVTGFSKI